MSNEAQSMYEGDSSMSKPFSVYVYDTIPDCIKDKFDQSKNDSIQNARFDNKKKILCHHYINSLNSESDCYFCPHYDKCLYAHGLKSQSIDDIKLQCLSLLIDGTYENNDVEFKDKMYKNLFIFVDVCHKCIELENVRIDNYRRYGSKFFDSLKTYTQQVYLKQNISPWGDKTRKHCIGGINCRHGSPFKELKICKEHFFKGSCHKKLRDILIEDPELLEFKKTDFVPSGCDNGLHIHIESYYTFRKFIDNMEPKDPKKKILVINMDLPTIEYDPDFDKIFSEFMKETQDTFFS